MSNDTEITTSDVDGITNVKSMYEILLEAIYSEDPNFKTQEEGESDRDYLIRFMEGVAGTPLQSTFDALPVEAREWFNSTANALTADANAAVEMPQGFVSVYDETAPQLKTDKKKRGRGRPAGATAKPKAEKKTREKEAKIKKTGRVSTIVIREAVIANPNATIEQINDVLVKAGLNNVAPSTISTSRLAALSTLRIAKAAGVDLRSMELPE